MRIAILSCFNGIWNGGGESWSIDLCEQLQQLGHTCLLVQGGAEPPPLASFRTVALAVPVLRHVEHVPRHLATKVINRCYLGSVDRDTARIAATALPALAAFRPDVIVPVNNFWSVLAAKVVRRARVVVTGHMKGWSRVERDTMRLGIDGFVATQPRAYQSACQFARGRSPVALIPNGVDTTLFASGPAAVLPLQPPAALVVSSLLPYKRVDLAVRAAARAGLSLLVVGDGAQGAQLDALGASLLGPERYRRIAHVPHERIAPYFRAAQVFTLPSDESEAFGVVIIEALAAGLPVVVNDDPVRRWIAGESGYYVDARDLDGYARALRAAAARGLAEAPSAQLERFSWPHVAARYAAFYAQVCHQDAGHPRQQHAWGGDR